MTNSQLYSQAWLNYRKVRNRALAWLAAFAVVPLSAAYTSVRIMGSLLPGFVAAFITMSGAVYSMWQLITWACPRCGEVFGAPVKRRCRNCSLAKWDNNSPEGT